MNEKVTVTIIYSHCTCILTFTNGLEKIFVFGGVHPKCTPHINRSKDREKGRVQHAKGILV